MDQSNRGIPRERVRGGRGGRGQGGRGGGVGRGGHHDVSHATP